MSAFRLRCVECGTEYAEERTRLVCDDCAVHQEPGGPIRGALEVEMRALPDAWPAAAPHDPTFLDAFLPLGSAGSVPPLAVGGTPLLPVPGLRRLLRTPRLFVKDDTRNPSGSTKDRASLLVVAKAREYGYRTVAAASTGNAATALAALGAAAGLRSVLFVPAAAPEAKLVQMLAYGAEVVPVHGSYDDAFELCLAACAEFGWYNRNTALNPFTVEGKKTVALEIAAATGPEVPDAILVPTGDGAILAGVAKGFLDLERAGLTRGSPRLIAVQPEGSAAFAQALKQDAERVASVPDAHSVADSLVVQAPRNAISCLRRIRESGGGAVVVSDEAILEAISELARHTGVFAEPAGAAALAGLRQALSEGLVLEDEHVVLLVTGTGLKDVAAAAQTIHRPGPVPPDLAFVRERFAG